jgi:hypothetical protein
MDALADHFSFLLAEGQKHIEGEPSHAKLALAADIAGNEAAPWVRRPVTRA